MENMNFALIGCAGYIARKHVEVIKKIGGNLLFAIDPVTNVGFIDNYYPYCKFYKEFEIFYNDIRRFINSGNNLDYIVICSPSYLHYAHCALSLPLTDVICEKPICLSVAEAESLIDIEDECCNRVNTILQLRLNEDIIKLRLNEDFDKEHNVDIIYNSPRGDWYNSTWKVDKKKSGGLITNIGIHILDLLVCLFECKPDILDYNELDNQVFLKLKFRNSIVRLDLGIENTVAVRKFIFDGKTIDLNNKFTDLHLESYQNILAGDGFTTDEVLPSLYLIDKIRRL